MESLSRLRPSYSLAIGFVLLLLAYGIATVFARLFLSPIRRVPGPKLAAATRWYEFYYEVILKGQYTFHIQDLHKKYGPIVRVTPEEVHVSSGRILSVSGF